jgi:hypothetical protein
VHVFAFGLHDLAERPREYSSGSYPFGGNFWVRALVFSGGLRYSEHIGPAPQKRLMGSETTFLRSLEKAGHRMFYVPDAVVGHRIQSQELNKKMIIRRAVRLGRSNPHVYGLPDADLLKRSRTRWLTKRLHQIARACLVEARAVVTTRESKRFERRCAARRAIALQLEAIRLSLDEQKAVRYVCISTRVAPP